MYLISHSGLKLEEKAGVLGLSEGDGDEQMWNIHLGDGKPCDPIDPTELGTA